MSMTENEVRKCLDPYFCDKCNSTDCSECDIVKIIDAIRKGGVE